MLSMPEVADWLSVAYHGAYSCAISGSCSRAAGPVHACSGYGISLAAGFCRISLG